MTKKFAEIAIQFSTLMIDQYILLCFFIHGLLEFSCHQ